MFNKELGYDPNLFYKIIGPRNEAVNGGHGKWTVAKRDEEGNWQPGRWMPKVDYVHACDSGYHLCPAVDVLGWAQAATDKSWDLYVWLAEGKGDSDAKSDKTAFESARLMRMVIGHKEWWAIVNAYLAYVYPVVEALANSNSNLDATLAPVQAALKILRDWGERMAENNRTPEGWTPSLLGTIRSDVSFAEDYGFGAFFSLLYDLTGFGIKRAGKGFYAAYAVSSRSADIDYELECMVDNGKLEISCRDGDTTWSTGSYFLKCLYAALSGEALPQEQLQVVAKITSQEVTS